jgi:hypothetical protein
MKIDFVNEQNYGMLVEWWKGYSWPSIPYSMLPKTGIIVNDTVAGFIYATDSEMCLIEWIIGNPLADKKQRKECTAILFDTLCEIAKQMGYKHCFTYTKNTGLVDSLLKNKFNKTDDNMIHFMRSL